MHGKRTLQFGILFLACTTATALAQLRYVAGTPIVLRDGAGSTTFSVVNIGRVPLPLALKTGPFSDETSQVALATPRVTFSSVAGAPLPVKIDPGASIRVQVNVSSMSGASVAAAPLLSGELELGKLHAVETDAPLNISISDIGNSNQEMALNQGEDAVLTLKNNDSTTYPLDWAFQVGGKTLQSGELQLGPRGSSRIELTPTDDLYTWEDAVRPSSKTGVLLLSLHGPPEVARDLLPERSLQLNLLMRRLSPTWTSFWSHMFVMVVLLLGGLLSLIGNSVLPNILRKINLRRQVTALGERISSISARVDSHLSGLLRLERKRLELLLKRAWAFSLSSVETLDEVSAGVDRLVRRLKVAERLDEMRRRLDEVASTAPPSVTDDIDSKLQMAESELELFTLTEEEVTAANGYMDRAHAGLELLGNTEGLSRAIASNFRDLKVRQKFLPYSYYNDLKAALPGLFEMLNQPFDDFRNIPRQMLFAIDYGVAALQLAFDYAVMRESVAAAVGTALVPGQTSGPAARSARDRLIAHQKELVDLLGTLSWAALRELRALVQEMRENIYESDVIAEIANKGQAEIVLDPKAARPFEPVHFSIRFMDPRFNDAAAMRRLTCKWEFPGHTLEQNWKIYHFFQGNEADREEGPDVPVSVRVEGRKLAGTASARETARPVRSSLSAMVEVRRGERSSYSRAFAEGVRFLIAFGVALAALLAGALQELDKLDFLPAVIAILALGFAADSVKNLLSQSGKRTTA